ncbi:MAG: endonuclease III [Phycisphaerae bacterium]|nr:endonuclease III [Phycisphaerae bacterium]
MNRKTTHDVLRRLIRAYARPERQHRPDAVGVLIATILSQNTTDANSSRAFDALRKRFASWDALADARSDAIAGVIRPAGLSRQKAPRIRRICRKLRDRRGEISLEFLAAMPADDAYGYLLGFDGVGPKTALCVLLFAFDMPVFPVDTHIERITRRLGWLAPDVPAGRAHTVLTPAMRPRDRHDMHLLLIAHGRRTCRPQNPRCRDCPLLGLCSHGTAHGNREGNSADG